MTFNDDADIKGGRVSKRGRNTAIGIGGGGVGLIAIVLISQLLGVDLTGLVGGTSGTSSNATDTPLTQCTTGAQANNDIDCRMQAAATSLDSYWSTTVDGYTQPQLVIFDGSRTVLLRRETVRPTRAAKSKTGSELPDEARPLFERLREWRAGVAREQGVPAYIVFGDATLRGIALTKPSSLEQLGTISGVGEKKLESYGEGVLTVVAGESAAA